MSASCSHCTRQITYSSGCTSSPLFLRAGQRYYYQARVAGYAGSATYMQVSVRIANAATVAAAQASDPTLSAASPSVWKYVSPAAVTAHSVRARHHLQLSETVVYESQSFTIQNAVGGTFRLQFQNVATVSVSMG